MSVDLQNKINELTQSNNNLTKQVFGHSQGAEAMAAQLDAHKGMLNESLTASLQLKAHSILLEKQVKKLQGIIDALNKQVEGLNKQLEDKKCDAA
jgi:CII-binding regulator of phage lambda lysogenization HflD